MNFNLIVLLYAISGMLANIFYIPQITLYIKQKKSRGTISLITWGGWTFCGVIAFIYAIGEVGKIEMILVTGLNAFAQIFIFGLGLWHKFRSKHQPRTIYKNTPKEEFQNISDSDAVKLLIVVLVDFSKVGRRFKRRYLPKKNR